MLQRSQSMQRYAGHLTDELDDLSARAKILRTEALRLETEKAAILQHLSHIIEGADSVHLSGACSLLAEILHYSIHISPSSLF